MNFLCHISIVLISSNLFFCQVVCGAIVSSHPSSLISEFVNFTDDGIGGTLHLNTGSQVTPNNNLSSTMIEKIFLWTRSLDSGQQYELLDMENATSITASHFLPNKPSFILVHGFLGDGLEPWILGIKDKLLEQYMCNVISIQWPSGHQYFVIDYYHIVGHVPVVGAEIARLLGMLARLQEQKNNVVHIIGHSLGAHIAGFVGKNVDVPIGRISGLDPAGLRFHDINPSKRLDRSDATYVDVIHTNGCQSFLSWTDCFGIDVSLGHTDYWPNGGRHQPACHGRRQQRNRRQRARVNGTGQQSKVSWSVGCDHMMSHTYFLESLEYGWTSDMFRARPCYNYSQYQQGNCSCGQVDQRMGFSSDPRGVGNYFLNTSSTSPYALPDPACPGYAWKYIAEWIIHVNAISLYLLLTAVGVKCLQLYLKACRPVGRTQPEYKKTPNFVLLKRRCTCGCPDCAKRAGAAPTVDPTAL